MTRVHSFAPVATPNAQVLILGSMPGMASLGAGEYYAHPRNLFWPILGELVGARADLPYPTRLAALGAAGIALWDVLRSCERQGSLDSAIAADSLVANDFAAFFVAHPHIRRIYFNGAKAEACFRREVLAGLAPRPLVCVRLPSTSPANAGFSYAERLAAWRVLIDDAG